MTTSASEMSFWITETPDLDLALTAMDRLFLRDSAVDQPRTIGPKENKNIPNELIPVERSTCPVDANDIRTEIC
jgi:hypothetical protein